MRPKIRPAPIAAERSIKRGVCFRGTAKGLYACTALPARRQLRWQRMPKKGSDETEQTKVKRDVIFGA